MHTKSRFHHDSEGFALVIVLLLMLVMTAMTLALLLLVNGEGKANGNDLQHNVATYKALGGVEKLSSDIIAMYTNKFSPGCADYNNLSSLAPSAEYSTYSAIPITGSPCLDTTPLVGKWELITSGNYTGLYAQILPITLNVGVNRGTIGNESALVSRIVDVALIPAFQFGIFSDTDLGFFNTPDLGFNGRVHTNGNLFLTALSGATVSFNDRITAVGKVIRTVTPNNLSTSGYSQTGSVKILTTSMGCSNINAGTCRSMSTGEGSVTGNSLASLTTNPSWSAISKTTYNQEITNASTGAAKLILPFVGTGSQAYELIRRPSGELLTSNLGASRLYNKAQIRILLSDNPFELSPLGAADPDNVRLANVSNLVAGAPNYSNGVPITGTSYYTYFAEASMGVPAPASNTSTTMNPDWKDVPKDLSATPYGTLSNDANNLTKISILRAGPTVASIPSCKGCPTASYPYFTMLPASLKWNLIDGYLRVEYVDTSGTPNAVTQEWLRYGFARGDVVPKTPGSNSVHSRAILVFQKPADRLGDGVSNSAGTPAPSGTKYAIVPDIVNDTSTHSPYFSNGDGTTASDVTRFNWYPINFYDTREGENRDTLDPPDPSNDCSTTTSPTQFTCTALGVLNAVELDVGNLKYWLENSTNGKLVDSGAQNGYIVYFSDRRGMLPSDNGTAAALAHTKTGDSGLEDSINVNGSLEGPGGSASPEDVNMNTSLDNWGAKNLGAGFYNGATNINTAILASPVNSAIGTRVSSCTAAGKTFVSGARHVLKLIDGGKGNLPLPGFTVASENPVYVYGDYNTNAGDTIWSSGTETGTHSASAVIADAVTLLSNTYTDLSTLANPRWAKCAPSRAASATYYRMAVAAGKNKTFPYLYTDGTHWNFGTDGGVANFLRFLENWYGTSLNYEGSMVSLYYSTYSTGIFKCCEYSVYEPPVRNYVFDPLFRVYSTLPPGTPMFRLIQMLGYKQIFAARSSTD